MEARRNRKDTFTVTGVFASRKDAENAYHLLMELGYAPEEVTLIMSDETGEKICGKRKSESRFVLGRKINTTNYAGSNISDAIDSLGKFVALPGVALMVAGDFQDGGVSALINSVMSDKYAGFYKSVIKDGEIVIDFTPHSAREKNIIMNLWENYRGYPVIRKAENAA